MHTVTADLIRLGLTGAWGWAAWSLLRSKPKRPLRSFAGYIAFSWALYYVVFNASSHLGWSLAWHNTITRILGYATAAVLMVWGKRSLEYQKERWTSGLDT